MRYRHFRTGTTYTVLHDVAYSTNESQSRQPLELVVYRSDTDGKVWVRPRSEFYGLAPVEQTPANPILRFQPVEDARPVIDKLRQLKPGEGIPLDELIP